MTIPDLIDLVLNAIRNQFYADRVRDFKRDERALTKAIARYGYECHQRGWEFDQKHILAALMKLLNEIKRSDADIDYLPLYLDGAVKRHIGQRAEELSAAAKSTPLNVARLVKGVKAVEAIREPSATEILATVYNDLRRRRRPKPQIRRDKLRESQTSLF